MNSIPSPNASTGPHRILASMVMLLFIFGSLMLILTGFSVQGEVLQNVEQVTNNVDEYSKDPHVIEDSQGQLAMAYKLTTSTDSTGDIYFVRTTDGDSWDTPVQVTTSAKKDSDPVLTEGDNGNFYIAFDSNRDTQGQGQSWDVYLTKSTNYGQTWSTPTFVFGTYPNGDTVGGITAVGDDIWMSVREGGNPKMIISDDDGDTWGSKNSISTSQMMDRVSLIRNSDGDLVAAFAHDSDEKVRIRISSTGTSWSEVSATDIGIQPNRMTIAQDSDDDYWLTFHDDNGGDNNIYITKSSDLITWSQVEQLTDDDDTDSYPSVAPRNGDMPKVCWNSDRDGNNELFCGDVDYEEESYDDFDELLITNGHPVADDGQINQDPSTIIDSQGKFSMVWRERVDGSDTAGELYFSRSTDTYTWDTPIQVTTSVKRDTAPVLTEGDAGEFYIAFQSNRDTEGKGQSWDVYLTKSTDYGQTWSTPDFVVGNYPDGEAAGGIAVDGDTIWITYSQDAGGNNPLKVIKSTNNGDSWSTVGTVTSSKILNVAPIMMDSSGYLVVPVSLASDEKVHFYRSLTGASWTEESLENFGVTPNKMALIQNDNDIFWLAMHDDSADNENIYIAKGTDISTWGEATQITNHLGYDGQASHVMTSSDNMHLFWESDRDGESQVYSGEVDYSQIADPVTYEDFDELLITNGHPVADDGQINQDPSTIIDSQGKFSMVWRERVDGSDTAGELYFSRSTDTYTWDTPVQVTTSAKRDGGPVLTEGDPGEFYIAFQSNRDTEGKGQSWDVYLTKSTDYGLTWSTPDFVVGNYPDGEAAGGIAVDGDTIWITHSQDGGGGNPLKVVKSTNNGDSWATVGTVTSSKILNVAPMIMDSSGYLVVPVSLASDEKVHFYRSLTGASWTEESLENFGVAPNKMALIQDDDDVFWLAMHDDSAGNDNVYIAKGTDLSTWGEATQITDNNGYDGQASHVMTSSNKMHLFWESDRGGDSQVYAGEVDYDSIPDPEPETPHIALLAPNPLTYTVEGGDLITADLVVEVFGNTVHNLMLNMVDDHGLTVDTDSTLASAEAGESPTFTLSFTVPNDSTDDFQLVVNALSDEVNSNQQTIYFEYEEEPDPDDIRLILDNPGNNIKFARGGETVSFVLTLEALGGDVHNVFLYVDTGDDTDLEVQLPASISVIPAGTTQTVTVTFTMPEDADSSSEYIATVTASSTEDISNTETLLIVYNPGDELTDPDSLLPAPGLPMIVMGLSAGVVIATSFRNGSSKRS